MGRDDRRREGAVRAGLAAGTSAAAAAVGGELPVVTRDLAADVGIPLVPYAKAGLAYALWRASTTAGTVTVDNVAGKGQSFGYHVAAGLAFQMDVLDPRTWALGLAFEF